MLDGEVNKKELLELLDKILEEEKAKKAAEMKTSENNHQ